MKLTHIGISHFRSIGAEPVIINLSKKITVLVGQNDCGKSNVLMGLKHISSLRPNGTILDQKDIDNHMRKGDTSPHVHMYGEPHEENDASVKKLLSLKLIGRITKNFEGGISSPELKSMEAGDLNAVFSHLGLSTVPLHAVNRQDIVEPALLRGAIDLAKKLATSLPNFFIVPQFRRIDNTEQYSMDGKGIIKLLSLWQHPEIGKDALRWKFDRVEKLLRDLLERPNVTLEVPHTHREILVRDGNLRLPLESHGTGIHQLIIAIAVLSNDQALFGLEEPEIHLHPVLQRRFFNFLKNDTKNQYVITTHSPALIAPSDDVDVIHLKMLDGVTIPNRITTDAHTLAVLDDIGVRPSDLLQANCVLWVEGPSDRIYIKRWLEIMDSKLVEGIDYSVMFYGGRLLSHLTLDRDIEQDISTFVQLLRINQHSAIVMDSDRKKASDSLNSTKTRVIDESRKNGLFSWVTDGREIENYLSSNTVEAALNEHTRIKEKVVITETGKFDESIKQVLDESAPLSCEYSNNKVVWAHRFAPHIQSESVTGELKNKLEALIAFIRRRSR